MGKSVHLSKVVEVTDTDTEIDAETQAGVNSSLLKQEKEIEAWCAWLDRYLAVIKVRREE